MGALETIQPFDTVCEGKGTDVGIKGTTSDFEHISNGNWDDTLIATESYLVSRGVPKQSRVADLIMFMERSFAGKYMFGKLSHYQRIMPSKGWPKGDTLSEKLPRCRDKESFKKKFDHIGTTATLTRSHFDKFEISNMDFKDRMYLRLIDTNNRNVSIFFRNDPVVDSFIKSALLFNKSKSNSHKTRIGLTGKPEVVGGGKPAVVYLENPNPLLYTGCKQGGTGKNKNNLLTLIHSSTGKIKDQNPTPTSSRGQILEEKDSNFGFSDQEAIEAVGLGSQCEKSIKDRHRRRPTKRTTGVEVFNIWRGTVLGNHPDLCISANPTGKELDQAKTLNDRFLEFFPLGSIEDLFRCLNSNWVLACKELKAGGCWQNLGCYPEIPSLLSHSNRILTWYARQMDKAAKPVDQKNLGMVIVSPPVQTEAYKSAPRTPAPLKGCDMLTDVGRTFCHPCVESLEYQIAFMCGKASGKFDPLEAALKNQLLKHCVDLAASSARIEELRALPDDEAERYCC